MLNLLWSQRSAHLPARSLPHETTTWLEILICLGQSIHLWVKGEIEEPTLPSLMKKIFQPLSLFCYFAKISNSVNSNLPPTDHFRDLGLLGHKIYLFLVWLTDVNPLFQIETNSTCPCLLNDSDSDSSSRNDSFAENAQQMHDAILNKTNWLAKVRHRATHSRYVRVDRQVSPRSRNVEGISWQ